MLFARLGHLVYRRRKAVLALTGLFVAFAGLWGTAVFGALDGGGFDDPQSESSRAVTALEADLGRSATDVVVVYRAPEGSGLTVDSPEFRAAVSGALDALPADDVVAVTSFWSTGGAPLFVSQDRRATYVAVQLAGADEEARDAAYERIADDLVVPDLTTLRGGQVPLFTDVNTQVSEDIARAESLSIPLLIILLVLVFGSLAAASLPLAVGLVAILGAFTALRALSLFGDVSIFSVNIVTMLGLGLAIDYALFVVSRFREQLHEGLPVEDAVVRTVATAGRTVAFSGITVAVSLSALLLFPQNFLRSMGRGRDRRGSRGHGGRADAAARAARRAGTQGRRLAGPAALDAAPAGPASRPGRRRLGASGSWRDAAPGAGHGGGRRRPGRARRAVPAGHLRWRRLPRAAGRDREPARRRGAPGRLPELERQQRGRRRGPSCRRSGRGRRVRRDPGAGPRRHLG